MAWRLMPPTWTCLQVTRHAHADVCRALHFCMQICLIWLLDSCASERQRSCACCTDRRRGGSARQLHAHLPSASPAH
jgi:hypothetical protein